MDDTKVSIGDFKNILKGSDKVLITTHVNPDPDAVGSALAVYELLLQQDKKADITMDEGLPKKLSFLKNFDQIEEIPLTEKLENNSYDLIILLDGNNFTRFSRNEYEKVKDQIAESGAKTVIIDHHSGSTPDKVDIHFYEKITSASELVYKIFITHLDYELDYDIAEAVMVGILGDTGRFLYKNKSHRNTFSVVSDLLDMGVKIESIHSEINSYSSNVIDLISVILANIKTNAGYTYSFIADSAKDKMVDQGLSEYEYSGGYHQALDQYIRNIDGNPWGFVVLPKYSDKGVYKCSFRANQDAGIDTSVFANALGGGGHSLASGCNFEAGSIEEAVEKVKTTVKEKYKEASK